MKRREFLRSTGVGGVAVLAGCINPPQDGDNQDDTNNTTNDRTNNAETSEESSAEPQGDRGDLPHDVQIVLDNVDSSSWTVSTVNGGDGIVQGEDNPTLELTVGTRYRIDNLGSQNHPLAFRDNNGDVLLSQSQTGRFEEGNSVYWRDEEKYVEFTVTEELAGVLSEYHCEVHSTMAGQITTN